MRPYLSANHNGPRIRHPALSQSTRLCFFSPPPSLFQFPWVLFILSEILFHDYQPTTRGRNGLHLLVCASQSVFFSPKALVVCISRACLPCHCVLLIHSQNTQSQGEIPQPPTVHSAYDYVCVCTEQECHL